MAKDNFEQAKELSKQIDVLNKLFGRLYVLNRHEFNKKTVLTIISEMQSDLEKEKKLILNQLNLPF